MKTRLVETGLGNFRVGKTEMYIVITHHAEERLAERLPLLDSQDVKEDLEVAIDSFQNEAGTLDLGSYIVVNETSGLTIPVIVQKNTRPGYQNQVIGIIPTIMDYRNHYQYGDVWERKYPAHKQIWLEAASKDYGELLLESTNVPFGFTLNGVTCKWIMLD